MAEPASPADLRAQLVAERDRLKREIADIEAPSALNASAGIGNQQLDAELRGELAAVEHRLARLDAGAGRDVGGETAASIAAVVRANPAPYILVTIVAVIMLSFFLAWR